MLRARTFTNVAFAVSTTAIAVACTWKVTSSAATTGPSTQGDLPEHALLVVAAVSAQLLLLSLRTGRPGRRAIAIRLAAAAVVLAVMGTTYALAAHSGAEVVYRLAFHGYLSYALVESLRLCLRYGRSFQDAGRRMNLALIGWGSAVGLIYSASRLLYVLVDLTVAPDPVAIHTAGSVAALIGASGIALGVLAPRSVRAAQRWHRAVTQTRCLDPLWSDLTTTFPDVTLPTSAPTSPHRAELRHHRRLLEVAEGLARAHVQTLSPAVGDLDGLADDLHTSRPDWATGAGPTAADLLPAASSADDERRTLTDLARAYRARHASTEPARSGAPT